MGNVNLIELMKIEAEAWLGDLDSAEPIKVEHFCTGWSMYPDYWRTSTVDWKAGFLARKRLEKE